MKDGRAPSAPIERKHLQSLISGLAEGIVIIENDGRISWANEAALVLHGVEKASQLGADLADYYSLFELSYRNHHFLAAEEYPGQRVLRGEALKDVVVNVAKRGEDPAWVHKVRTLVLSDDGEWPGFSALIIDSATEEVDAETRFERAFNANPAPAAIVRLDDFRFIKVNRGFLEMTGYHRDAVIGHSAYEVDVLENADRRELAVKKLQAGEPIPQMEAQLALPAGGWKTVIVAGQPIEVDDLACMLFTFIDLEHKKKAEVALRQSEERFAKVFQLAPVPMLVSSLKEFRILNANDAFIAEFGHGRTKAVGRSKTELELWGDDHSRRRIETLVQQTGRANSVPITLKRNDGRMVKCLLSADTVVIHEEECVLSVMQNVDEKYRLEGNIMAAVEAALEDSSWLGQKIVEKLSVLTDGAERIEHGDTVDLSARQREVLALVAQGLCDVDIAAKLKIAQNTIRNHLRSIYVAVGVHRRSEAIVWARKRGIETSKVKVSQK